MDNNSRGGVHTSSGDKPISRKPGWNKARDERLRNRPAPEPEQAPVEKKRRKGGYYSRKNDEQEVV